MGLTDSTSKIVGTYSCVKRYQAYGWRFRKWTEKLKEEITCVTIRSWVFPIVWRVKVKT
jgi:hypothetical protein